MDDEHLPLPQEKNWWHAGVACAGDTGVSPEAARALSDALSDQRFHFLRKDKGLRLRTERPVADLLDRLVAHELISSWVGGVYEPETEAFGGMEGMDVAHELFCADSRPALAEAGLPGGKERCLLLLTTLFRSAGLDPFETGDVWARLASLRPPATPPSGPAYERAVSAMRRLMNTDAAQRPDSEPGWSERVAVFADAGQQLRNLANRGLLTRGLRAVLAHHAVFAFNRAGVPVDEQAAAAWLGRHVCFADT